MASRKRIKVVRGFRGTRHHGLAPGRKAKPIIKESCSPALGHGPGRVPRGVRPRANDLIGIATRRDHGRGWP
jgi:hypothetical protein